MTFWWSGLIGGKCIQFGGRNLHSGGLNNFVPIKMYAFVCGQLFEAEKLSFVVILNLKEA